MKVQVMPYRGRTERITKGHKTTINLEDNYLHYMIKYKHKALVERVLAEEEVELPFYEEGYIIKSSVAGISRMTENDIKTVDENEKEVPVDVIEVHVVSLSYSGEEVHFSCNTKEEADKLYKALIEWKFNTKINNDDNTI